MNFNWDKIDCFVDETGVKWTRGPWEFSNNTYEWKLEDSQGTDYCNSDQLELWNVKLKKDLSK